MMEAVMVAAQRLAEALRAENAALARLDLAAAGELGEAKRAAAEAFAAAFAAARQAAARPGEAARAEAEAMVARLGELTAENRRLLERAIALQSRVIEVIAGAARPPGPGTYGARGRAAEPPTPPVSLLARA